MFRPSDLQLILLTAAIQRSDGSLLPAPDSVGAQASRINRSISPLVKHGLVSEAPVSTPPLAWRSEDGTWYGAFITDIGREMIGAEPVGTAAPVPAAEPVPSPTPVSPPLTKIATVHALLCRELGATLEELVVATDWQPHTMRAALTRLRQKGHLIAKSKRDGTTCYSLPQAG